MTEPSPLKHKLISVKVSQNLVNGVSQNYGYGIGGTKSKESNHLIEALFELVGFINMAARARPSLELKLKTTKALMDIFEEELGQDWLRDLDSTEKKITELYKLKKDALAGKL